jgi:hypothetical protein
LGGVEAASADFSAGLASFSCALTLVVNAQRGSASANTLRFLTRIIGSLLGTNWHFLVW